MSGKAEMVAEVIGPLSTANKVTTAGAVTGVVGWLTQINWIGLSGVLIALAGLAVSSLFQFRRDKREAQESAARQERENAESAARIAAIKAGLDRERA